MGESDVQGILRKLDDHESIFRDITADLATIKANFIEQKNFCQTVQGMKKSKREIISQIKIGIIVSGFSVLFGALVTYLLLR